MARPAKITTLEGHRAAVENATANNLAPARSRARKFCIARGLDVPAWCTSRPPGAYVHRAPEATEHDEPTIDIPTAVAALRSAWSGPSKAFALAPRQVTLIDLSEGSTRRAAAFASVDAALQAIAADAIKWAPLRPGMRSAIAAVA